MPWNIIALGGSSFTEPVGPTVFHCSEHYNSEVFLFCFFLILTQIGLNYLSQPNGFVGEFTIISKKTHIGIFAS